MPPSYALTGPASSGHSVCAPGARAFSWYRRPPAKGRPCIMLFTSWRRPRKSAPRHRRSARRFRPHTANLLLESLESRSLLSTFVVTSTGDNGGVNPAPGAGTGTLRQALVDADAANTGTAANPDLIQFNIPPSD